MYIKFQPFFIIAESPVHAGSGSETGIVDLPIQRERYTNFPKIEGSGLKGSIREAFRISEKEIEINGHKFKVKEHIDMVFGPKNGNEYASAISFTDAKILLFPVKSLKGVFAWITCPMVLNRFMEDIKFAGYELNWEIKRPSNEKALLTSDSDVGIDSDSKIVLEEYTYTVDKTDKKVDEIADWFSKKIFPSGSSYEYWRDKIKKSLVILSDDEFKNFVSTSTEVITRTKIDVEIGTVESGALWTEEYLPQDTILYSIAMFSPLRVKEENKKAPFKVESEGIEKNEKEAEIVREYFSKGKPDIIQIGGNQTIGKGIVRIKVLEREGKNE